MTPDLLADPETDRTATYAVDPGLARRLTARVVCAPRPARLLTHTPMTGAPFASLPQSTPSDVKVAYAAARAAQRSWARMSMPHRARIFLRFHDLVLEHQAQLLDLIQLESGKARVHGATTKPSRQANDSDYGLNASVWTRDVARGRQIAGSTKAGTVNINDGYAAAWGSVGAPMGGMKSSGLSRRHGIEGITKYTEPQNITAQHVLGFAAPFGLSDERWAATLTVALGTMKRLGVR